MAGASSERTNLHDVALWLRSRAPIGTTSRVIGDAAARESGTSTPLDVVLLLGTGHPTASLPTGEAHDGLPLQSITASTMADPTNATRPATTPIAQTPSTPELRESL